MNDGIIVTNIQRFSLYDGPGIRTAVFFKGCSIHCPWCSNPENINPEIEEYSSDSTKGIYGKEYSSQELLLECIKDRCFYQCDNQKRNNWIISDSSDVDSLPGGVTLTGGECLLQTKSILSLCQSLNELNIHITVESSLYAPIANLKSIIDFIDLFYIDVKLLNPNKCKEIQKANVSVFLENFDYLLNWKDRYGNHKPVIIRIPVIGNYTDSIENISLVTQLLDKYKNNILRIELLKEHKLAEKKYKSLNRSFDYNGVDFKTIEYYKNQLEVLQVPTIIYSI